MFDEARVGLRSHGARPGGEQAGEGSERALGRVRWPKGLRQLSQGFGAGDLLQPSPVQSITEGG